MTRGPGDALRLRRRRKFVVCRWDSTSGRILLRCRIGASQRVLDNSQRFRRRWYAVQRWSCMERVAKHC